MAVFKFNDAKLIMNDVLLRNFENNQYFKFSDFVYRVQEKLHPLKKIIEYEQMRDFMYELIDEKKVELVYVNENENPFLPEHQRSAAVGKSIHYKIIINRSES